MSLTPAEPRAGARGAALRAAARSPALRMLLAGGILMVLVRMLPAAAPAGVAAVRPSSHTVGGSADPVANDPERLLWLAAAGVAAEDAAVRGRLLKLARHLELGRGATDTDAELIAAARAAGIAGNDVVIRRYLTELLRLALERPGATDRPTEAELRDFHERNTARFTTAARVRATQVYVRASSPWTGAAGDDKAGWEERLSGAQTSRPATGYAGGGRAGPKARLHDVRTSSLSTGDTARALALLDRLRVGAVSPTEAGSYGDPFVRGPRIEGTLESITRAFGPEFAQGLEGLPLGEWQGPLASAHGLHLVWVEERLSARRTPLDAVRGQVVHGLLRERGLARAEQRLAALGRTTRDPSFARSRSGGPQ